LVDRLEHEG
jgi:hypothetical protein